MRLIFPISYSSTKSPLRRKHLMDATLLQSLLWYDVMLGPPYVLTVHGDDNRGLRVEQWSKKPPGTFIGTSGQRYKDSYANRCETWQNIATRCSNIKSRNRMFSKKNWLTRQWTVPYVFRYLWSKEIILVSSHLKNIFRWMFRSKDWSSQYFKAGLGSTTHDLPWVSATIYSVLLGVLGTRFPVRRYSC